MYYNSIFYRRKYTVNVSSNTITFEDAISNEGQYANWFLIPMKIYKA